MSLPITKHSQHLLVAHALKKDSIASMLLTVLEPAEFSVPELQIIWKNLITYWNQYKKLPTYQEFIEYVPESVVMLVAELYATTDLEEIPSIVEKAVQFKKAQHLKRVVDDVSFTINTDPDKAEAILRTGISTLPMLSYNIDEMADLLPQSIMDYNETTFGYPIGLSAFSGGLEGGVRTGEVFFVAAPPGMGKSTILCSIAGSVALFTPTLFITLELSKEDVVKKISARLSGKRLSTLDENLSAKGFIDVNMRVRQAFPVYIEYYSSGTLSVSQIGGIIDYLKTIKKIKIGAVFIDYADLLRPPSEYYGKADWEKVAQIWQNMVDLAKVYKVAVFTASQLSKEKADIYNTEEIQQKDISGTKEKIHKCDVGLAFKPVGLREGNVQKGIWSWLKVRRGKLPESFFGAMDYDRMQPVYIKPYTRQEDVEVLGMSELPRRNKKAEPKPEEIKTLSKESGVINEAD